MIDERTQMVDAQLNSFEMLLCFEQWCRHKTFWAIEQQAVCLQRAREAVVVLLESIKESFPRGVEKEGWRLAKFHHLKHMVEDIAKFGAPENTSANRPEHNHRYFAKMPGRRSQKRHHTFNRQVARRLADSWVLRHLEHLLEGTAASHRTPQGGFAHAMEALHARVEAVTPPGTDASVGGDTAGHSEAISDPAAVTTQSHTDDALDESVGSGTKYWVVWEFHDRTPKSTHGELVVHVLSFDGKSRIPPTAVDGPTKMESTLERLGFQFASSKA